MKTYVCLECNFSTLVAATLTRHEKRHHGIKGKFECPYCSYTSNIKFNLQQHVKAVHEKIRLQCQHCQYSSSYNQELARHMKHKHRELEVLSNHDGVAVRQTQSIARVETLVQEDHCRQCKKSNTKENILQHIIVTHGAKPFSCIHCEYSVRQKINLLQHIKAIHYRIKDLKCPYCSFMTAWNTSIRDHIKSVHHHLGEHPVQSVQQEMGGNSSLEDNSIGNQALFFTLSWQKADMNEASTSCSEALDIVNLTHDDDEKKLSMLKQYKCGWCSSNSDPNNYTLEEMESHLQENHCLTLKEYRDMNEISFS